MGSTSVFTDEDIVEQSGQGACRGADAHTRIADMEYQSVNVECWTAGNLLGVSVVESVRDRLASQAITFARVVVPERYPHGHRQTRGKQNRQCSAIRGTYALGDALTKIFFVWECYNFYFLRVYTIPKSDIGDAYISITITMAKFIRNIETAIAYSPGKKRLVILNLNWAKVLNNILVFLWN